MLFESIRPEMDFYHEKYNAIVEKRREAGSKGGAPKGNKNAAGNQGGGAPLGNRNAAKKETPEYEPENKHKQNDQMLEFEPKKQTQAESVISNQKKEKEEFNAEKIPEPPQEPPEDQTASTAIAVAPKKSRKIELTDTQLLLFHAAKACFESSEKAKAIIYQDSQTTAREMRNLKTLVIRCSNMAPEVTADFMRGILEHFRTLINGKLRGKAVFTPRSLITPWIWELVVDSLPENDLTDEFRENVRELFRNKG
jgi:hypothetical protein